MLDNMTTGEKVIAGATAVGIAALIFHKPTRNAVGLADGKTKIYHNFKDKYGKEYSFDNYHDFATFWFNTPYKRQITFPDYKKLQFAAANSAEAKKRYKK